MEWSSGAIAGWPTVGCEARGRVLLVPTTIFVSQTSVKAITTVVCRSSFARTQNCLSVCPNKQNKIRIRFFSRHREHKILPEIRSQPSRCTPPKTPNRVLRLTSLQTTRFFTMAGGETYNERSKGKDVRTSNIVAAKVRSKA